MFSPSQDYLPPSHGFLSPTRDGQSFEKKAQENVRIDSGVGGSESDSLRLSNSSYQNYDDNKENMTTGQQNTTFQRSGQGSSSSYQRYSSSGDNNRTRENIVQMDINNAESAFVDHIVREQYQTYEDLSPSVRIYIDSKRTTPTTRYYGRRQEETLRKSLKEQHFSLIQFTSYKQEDDDDFYTPPGSPSLKRKHFRQDTSKPAPATKLKKYSGAQSPGTSAASSSGSGQFTLVSSVRGKSYFFQTFGEISFRFDSLGKSL